jgi:hypothetical protein
MTNIRQVMDDNNPSNLMICRWDNE